MSRPLYSAALFAALFTQMCAGLSVLHAEQPEDPKRSEMEAAISAYQEGSQGDVIRYFMQRGYEGNVAAAFNLGVINYQRKEAAVGLKEARFWFGEAAEDGDLVAQMNLGLLLIDAGISTSDWEQVDEGVRWLRRSAESGYRPAQVNLGGLIVGKRVNSPYSNEGMAWLQVASEAGDPRASQMLGALSSPESSTAILALLYPVEQQLRSAPYRGGSEVKTEGALVYAEPSDEQNPIASMRAGSLVEVVDRSGNWARVKIPAGLPVWIESHKVKVEADLVRVDRLEAPLFSAPNNGTEAVGMGTVTKGETLELLENNGEWLMVRSPERFAGWMQFEDIVSKTEIVFESVEDKSIADTPEARSAETATITTVTMISDAELLKLPDRGSELLGVVAKDIKFSIADEAEGFVFANLVQVTGWVSQRLLDLERNTETQGVSATVNTDVARVRTKPALESKDFGRLLRGNQIPVIEQLDGWVRVELGSGSGWIVSRLVTTEMSSSADSQVTGSNTTESVDGASTQSDVVIAPPEDEVDELPQPALVEEIGEEEQLAELDTSEQVIEVVEQSEVEPLQENGEVEMVVEPDRQAEQSSVPNVKPDTILYAENSTDSQPLGRMVSRLAVAPKNAEKWVSVDSAAAIYGWVFATLTEENDGQARIITDGVRIRLDPTTEKENVIGSRNRGDTLSVLSRRDGWLQVVLEPETGWVQIADIE